MLIAIPLLLIGMVSPYALRLAVDTVDATGRTAGRLYAISTLGSLVGTFLAALLLIPFVGTRRTFLIFAAAMALAAVPSWTRGRVRAAAVPVAILGLVVLPTGTIKTADTGGDRVIWEAETQYQYARVLQAPDGERTLELDEGYAVHSVYRPGHWLTGNYWDEMLALSLAGRHAPPRSVAILGDAAGTSARQIGHYFPQTRIDAVELDGELTKVGREFFDLRGPNLHTLHRGRAAVALCVHASLRRHHDRRLPPALHPLLPHHRRVLHTRPRPPRAGRPGHRQRRPTAGVHLTGEGAECDDARGVRVRRGLARPLPADQHHARRHDVDRPGRAAARATPGLPADLSLVVPPPPIASRQR